ncbi:unnamed protein product [Clonostachys solani]|uniref:DUF676 domain-containing protein n=1 Tax=Clonostachys solani TaxID=160281 RepID=A0A9N9W9W5_9HYPO|nr:unnamed protein product [Clonostachys solani]
MSNGVRAGHVSGAGKVFRVQGIPLDWNVDRLGSVLESEGDFLSPSVRSLAIEIHGRWNTATVSFIGVPQPIKSRIALPTTADQADRLWLTLDDHFHGITTLYAPEEYQINLISLSGLGGHAFGSFKERGGEHMWLRDSLPHHLVGQNEEPLARIMIYGYESSVPKSQSFQNITDLATTFRSSLLALATEKNILPIVFIAHSLGGLLAKELLVLVSQSENADEFRIFQAVFGLVFFGVPHGGMDIQSLVPMAGDGPNRPLIDSLGITNPKTREKREEAFFKALGKREIIGFYETLMSPTAQQDDSGRWKMDGPPTVLVTKESATHRRHWAPGPEQLCAINRNHSEMVKFRPHDSDYENALQLIKGIAQRAISVSQQFSQAGNIALGV